MSPLNALLERTTNGERLVALVLQSAYDPSSLLGTAMVKMCVSFRLSCRIWTTR